MLAKVSSKNQLTLPKALVNKLGFSPHEEKYLDLSIEGNTIVMKPVTVTIEEKIPEAQWSKFHQWATKVNSEDMSFKSADQATQFLKKRSKKG